MLIIKKLCTHCHIQSFFTLKKLRLIIGRGGGDSNSLIRNLDKDRNFPILRQHQENQHIKTVMMACTELKMIGCTF